MPRKSADTLPALPTQVFSVLGPVPVIHQKDLKGDDPETAAQGSWSGQTREIHMDIDTYHPLRRWKTACHEMVHMMLEDGSVNEHFDSDDQEMICDAVGLWMAAAVARGFLKFDDTKA